MRKRDETTQKSPSDKNSDDIEVTEEFLQSGKTLIKFWRNKINQGLNP